MQIVKAAILYFALVFGTGFVLGTIRTLWVAPRLGKRRAELVEAPFMLIATVVAAWWAVALLGVPPMPFARLFMGSVALGLMLIAEFGPMLWLRRISIKEYLATRDRVSGTAYYVLLGLFALMPLCILSV